jgi:hypothetical protein
MFCWLKVIVRMGIIVLEQLAAFNLFIITQLSRFLALPVVPFLFISSATFRRLQSVSVLRWNVLSWTPQIELVPVSGPESERADR